MKKVNHLKMGGIIICILALGVLPIYSCSSDNDPEPVGPHRQ